MKQATLKTVLGVVGGLILASVVYVVVMERESATQPTISTDKQEQLPAEVENPQPVVGRGSLLSLLSQALPLECTITYTDPEGMDTSGTYFVARGQVRGDFLVDIQGTKSVSSVIIADEMLYSWSEIDGETYGLKVNLATALNGNDANAPEVNTPVPLDTDVTYNCKPWLAVDGSVFVPPGDVLFQDFSTVMERGMETPVSFTTPDTDQCALCARVPAGEGQDECRAAFACQ